jgi:adenylate cyclase
MERKLTAILCADVHGYSRLMGENEKATLHTLTSYRKIIDALIEKHRGRFVNSAGDSVLAEFASVVNAVECAVEIQTALKAENASLPPEQRMELRIGVNLGDVMVEGEQIYGDGVNVAARLESLAEPGGICISGKVHEEIRNKLTLGYEDLGAQSVKNITEPVRVYRVLPEAGAGATPTRGTQRVQRKYVRRGVFSIAAGDYRRDSRARAAPIAAPADSLGVHSSGANPNSSIARQALDCRPAVHQHERRPRPGIFQ